MSAHRFALEETGDGWYIRDTHRDVVISEHRMTHRKFVEDVLDELNDLYDSTQPHNDEDPAEARPSGA